MNSRVKYIAATVAFAGVAVSCGGGSQFTGAEGEVKFVMPAPQGAEASLVLCDTCLRINPTVYVYGPQDERTFDFLSAVDGFNSRADNPTQWNIVACTSDDYLPRMLHEKTGNVAVLSGAIGGVPNPVFAMTKAGMNVMVVDPISVGSSTFGKFIKSFRVAKRHKVMIGELNPERYEIANILQRELVAMPHLLGAEKVVRVNIGVDGASEADFIRMAGMAQWLTAGGKKLNYRRDIKILGADSSGISYLIKSMPVGLSADGVGNKYYSRVGGKLASATVTIDDSTDARPRLVVTAADTTAFNESLGALAAKYPGVGAASRGDLEWEVTIPDELRTSPRQQTAAALAAYMGWLTAGRLPEKEAEAMKAKYYTISKAAAQ